MTQRETKAQREANQAREAVGPELTYWLTTPTADIFNGLLAPNLVNGDDQTRRHAFIDNGADVLAVAHLDTVQNLTGPTLHGHHAESEDEIVFATGLDDRLGAYAITHLLPFPVDLLYTDNEETGASTAEHFTPPTGKKYRYVMEFDRAGSDVVTYSIDSPEWLALLRSQGATVGHGSFTDLCYLDEDSFPVAMVNYGTGYEKAHAIDSYANLTTLRKMIELAATVNAAARAEDAPPQWLATNPARSGNSSSYYSYGYGYGHGNHWGDTYRRQSYETDRRGYQTREQIREAKRDPLAYFSNGSPTERFDDAFLKYCACCGSRMLSGRHYAVTEWPFCADCEPDLDDIARTAADLENQQKEILPF